ncbi:MAG: AAA family ATPase [Gammaproteobacteria bacterium]|nr:AAA family ATPase [Gammaproteobacteria bacterium]
MGTHLIARAVDQVGNVLLGKEGPIKLALACLLARGHLLIEDLPGMGKTIMSHALAKALGLTYKRIQFTSDMLPADVLGVSVFDRDSGEFKFHPGPIFAQVVLADEINRTTPKSQSALLEAMEEGQVTVEGETRELPTPFFVIATQNPATHAGTYPLPESQLDRFLMRIELGYPDAQAERELMQGEERRVVLSGLEACMSVEQLIALQNAASNVKTTEALIDYIQRLVHHSRQSTEFAYGLSPRGSLSLLRAAQAWALVHDRNHVLPEDVQAVLPSVVEHRLRESADYTGHGGTALAQRLLAMVDVVSA